MAYTLSYSYDSATTSYRVVGYGGTPDNVVIPNTYSGSDGEHPVTQILYRAFQNCGTLVKIIISPNVTVIGSNAFEGCSLLSEVVMLGNIELIGYCVFRGCSNLVSIDIPNSVSYVDDEAFCSCTSLVDIVIPNSATRIGSSAFRDCTSLKNVVIGNGVTSIGMNTFNNCPSIESVIVLPTTPPLMASGNFNDLSSTAKFYCFSSSINSYKSASNWNVNADKFVVDDLRLYFAADSISLKDYIRETVANYSQS